MEEWLVFAKDFGIPAVMCLWFMFRTEGVIKTNTGALKEMTGTIQACQKWKK